MSGEPAAADSTRDQLVAAVGRIVEARVEAPPTVVEIAREAGVSRPTVYAYFASSDDAFAAHVATVRDAALRIQEEADTTSLDSVYDTTLVASLDLQVRHVALFGLLAVRARDDPRMARMWHDIQDLALARHARFLARAVERGELEPRLPPWVVAEAVGAVTTRFAQLVAAEPARRDELAAELVAVQRRLIGADERGDGS